MRCDDVRPLLTRFAKGELSDSDKDCVQQHVEGCTDCSENLAYARALHGVLEDAMPHVFDDEEPEPETDGPEVPDALVNRLRTILALRDMRAADRLLNPFIPRIDDLDPKERNAGALLCCFALWMDLGRLWDELYSNLDLLSKTLAARFSSPSDLQLTLADYIHLRIARGLVALHEERHQDAIQDFQFVLNFHAEESLKHMPGCDKEISGEYLAAVAYFGIARCLSRDGKYKEALEQLNKAQAIAMELKLEETTAALRVLEAWLQFEGQGKSEKALAALEKSEVVLAAIEDNINLGNIESCRGRIARRQGYLSRAIQHYEKADAYYQKANPRHGNRARVLVNLAEAERLLARQYERNRNEGAGEKRRQALAHLRTAREIYESHRRYQQRERKQNRGMGTVHLGLTNLHRDAGDLEAALREAKHVRELGEGKNDSSLLARAGVALCAIENELCIADPGQLSRHAEEAYRFGVESVNHARKTGSERLLAKCYTWLARTVVNDYYNDPERANGYREKATSAWILSQGRSDGELAEPGGVTLEQMVDDLWQDLEHLKTLIGEKRLSRA